VESIIRDLTELAVGMISAEEQQSVRARAEELAEERVLNALLPPASVPGPAHAQHLHSVEADPNPEARESREKLRKLLRLGELDDREIDVELADDGGGPSLSIMTPQGVEEMGVQFKDLLGSMMPKRVKQRRMKVAEARKAYVNEEAVGLVDMEAVRDKAVTRVEQGGIVFIDEIDKVATGSSSSHGPDVSREGVQRDLLPIVEGSTVQTKQGPVCTDHILFIAAGAFHFAKPSDLIPELQGRFPIRVELASLTKDDLMRILTEPANSLVRQYAELMKTEEITLDFKEDGIRAVADIAAEVNERSSNIGARRLHTVMERLLDELSFDAPDMPVTTIVVDRQMVEDRLGNLVEDPDLSQYIL
jgi:ATP-dependent HslUV protease ATP-binding subunit HslU